MASITSRMVIILVTLAGSSFSCSFLAKRTVPVSFSISRAEGAETSTARTGTHRVITAHSSASSRERSRQDMRFMAVPP